MKCPKLAENVPILPTRFRRPLQILLHLQSLITNLILVLMHYWLNVCKCAHYEIICKNKQLITFYVDLIWK